ncbi:hypothetical protein [Muricoccus aerilatus]|uniref:hypothetical protein n=1 Tax=Muricoccus aerilatus TaxID=452982 RepID=UPI0005C1B821|nr:hypothetical protein [Roseomonas aerilata]
MARQPSLDDLAAWAEELVIGPRHPRRDVISDIRRRCFLMVSTYRRAAAAHDLPDDWPFCTMAPQRAR